MSEPKMLELGEKMYMARCGGDYSGQMLTIMADSENTARIEARELLDCPDNCHIAIHPAHKMQEANND